MYKIASVADLAVLHTPHTGLAERLEAMVARAIAPGCEVEAGEGMDRIRGRVTGVYAHVVLVEWTDDNGNRRKESLRLHDFLTGHARAEGNLAVAAAVRQIAARQQIEIADSRTQRAIAAACSQAV